jgi:cardiolipin synthase (CMP-forming)
MLTIPNLITLLRLFLVPCFIWASIEGSYTVACSIFVFAAVTDILDGAIARRLNQRSRLGALLDPAADKLLMVSGYLFYTLSRSLPKVAIPQWLTFTVFVRDFLIVLFAYLLYTRVNVKKFPPSVAGKTSTVMQAITLGVVVGVNSFLPSWLPFAQFMFRAALLMTLYSAFDYIRRAGRMLDEGLTLPEGASTIRAR